MEEDNNVTTAVPAEMDELLERIETGWGALMEAVREMSKEEMQFSDAGAWSVKDHLAHLTAWEQHMLSHYLQGQPAHRVMNLEAKTFVSLDADALNAIIYKRNRNRDVADVLADLELVHQRVVETLQETDFAVLVRDGKPEPVILPVIWNTYEHYEEHRLTIEALRGA